MGSHRWVYAGSYKEMSSFIFGLGSVEFNFCLTNSIHLFRRYIAEERDRMQGVRAFIGCYRSPKFNDAILNMYIISGCTVCSLWKPHFPLIMKRSGQLIFRFMLYLDSEIRFPFSFLAKKTENFRFPASFCRFKFYRGGGEND